MPRLTCIDISKCKKLTEEGILTFLQKVNPNIEVFVASHLRTFTDRCAELTLNFKKQRVLDLSYCSKLSPEFFEKMAQCAAKFKLTVLKLDGIRQLTSKLLKKLFEESKDTLQFLSLESCRFVSLRLKGEFKHLPDSSFINLIWV